MTVHRDLDELERQGVVRKYRGGVSAQPTSVFESNVAYRLTHGAGGEGRVGPARPRDDRARHVGDARRLDQRAGAGRAVRGHHSVDSGNELPAGDQQADRACATSPCSRSAAIYSATHDSFGGMPCAEAVEALHTDLLFCSVSAVSPTHAFHQEEEIVLVKRAMLRSARTKVLLVDHGKLQRTALHRLAPLTDFDLVVVDEKTSGRPDPGSARPRRHRGGSSALDSSARGGIPCGRRSGRRHHRHQGRRLRRGRPAAGRDLPADPVGPVGTRPLRARHRRDSCLSQRGGRRAGRGPPVRTA